MGLAPAAARRCRRPPWRCRGWPAALGLYALATALRGERWLRLLRDAGACLSRTDAYAVTTVGYMGNNALPARAGDLLKAVLSSRAAGAPTADGFGTLVAERVLDAVALVAIFAVLVTTLQPAARRRGLDAGGRRRRAGPRRGRCGLPRARHRRPVSACRSSRRACSLRRVACGRRRVLACWCCRSSCGSSRARSTPSWASWPACTSRCSTASTSWPWPTSWRSSRPRPATWAPSTPPSCSACASSPAAPTPPPSPTPSSCASCSSSRSPWSGSWRSFCATAACAEVSVALRRPATAVPAR